MSYDPTTDPRGLPPVEDDVPDAERLNAEEKLEQVQRDIEWRETVAATFDTAGWTLLGDLFAEQVRQLNEVLEKETDPTRWKFYRGELRQVEWLRQLPEENDRRTKQLYAQRRDLLAQLEGGT